jgi:hypothetical protein
MEGHKFYVLNTDAGSWACDMATRTRGHERQSFGLDYYRVGCSVEAYGKTLFGDNQTGKFYEPDLDVVSENGVAMPVTIELPPVGDGVSRQTLYAFEMFMETGVGDLTTTDPQAILTYSKNGGRSWSNEMWRDSGAQGEYSTRAVWRVNVEFRQLQLKIVLPDKVRRCVIGYFADVRMSLLHTVKEGDRRQQRQDRPRMVSLLRQDRAADYRRYYYPRNWSRHDAAGALTIAEDGVSNDMLSESVPCR